MNENDIDLYFQIGHEIPTSQEGLILVCEHFLSEVYGRYKPFQAPEGLDVPVICCLLCAEKLETRKGDCRIHRDSLDELNLN